MLCIRWICSLCRDSFSVGRGDQAEAGADLLNDEEYSTGTTDPFDSHNMAQNRRSMTLSQTASSLASWARRTLLGPKEDGEEEQEPLQSTTVLNETETEAESGVTEECPICTTFTKNKLASAVPCKHEACERCWQTWLKQQTSGSRTCMICAQLIRNVNFPSSNERAATNKGSYYAKHADETLEDALRAMLRIKTELLEITDKIDETQSHLSVLLQSAQAGMFDSDSATSVVQVEISTTRDQLDRLLRTSQMLPEADRTVSTLLRAMKDLDVVVRSYGSLNDWSRSSILSFIEVLTPSAKESRTALALQWKAVTDLLRDLLTNKLGVVHGMAMIMPMEGLALLALMERAKHAIMNGIPSIAEKVQTFETEAKRLIEKVRVAAEQHPTEQELIEAALSSATLADVKTE